MEGSAGGVALLRQKLDDPHTSEVLVRLLERVDSLEATLGQLTELVGQIPDLVATVTNVADDTVRHAAGRGVDIDARLRASLTLVERLSDPAMVRALESLMDLARDGEGVVATVGDMFDDVARDLDLDSRARAGGALLERATRPEVSTQIGVMLDTMLDADGGMLAPAAVGTLGVAAQALVAAREAPPRRATILQALRAARDPKMQRALGFLLEFGEQFANRLDP